MTRCYLWSESSIELHLTGDQVRACSHRGSCDQDVLCCSMEPAMARQLAHVSPKDLRAYLEGFGAWDHDELANHYANLQRLLWLACNDVNDAPRRYLA